MMFGMHRGELHDGDDERRLPKAALLVGLILALAAGCGATTQRSVPPRAYLGSQPPPGIHPPAFALLDQDGRRVTARDFRNKVGIVTFLDTACHDSCPLVGTAIGQALRELTPTERGQLESVAFSVDPRFDTPPAVRGFLARHLLTGHIHYLVGTAAAMRPVWHEFGVLPAVDTGNASVHSIDVRVFDRHGVWVSTLRIGEDLTPRNLVHDIRVALAA